MKLAIMQPYFLPYIGYFQLLAAADRFVLYDNIKYTKKGWINRNRYLLNGKAQLFSVPLKKDSDFLDVREREISSDYDREKLLNQFRGAYRKAPFFQTAMPLVENIVRYNEPNLSCYLRNSVRQICSNLEIHTPIHISSEIPIDHSLHAQDKVLAFCKELGATTYINAIGGLELYSKDAFAREGIELQFLRSLPFEYAQFGEPFVPWLSIADVLMFNSKEAIQARLGNVEFI